MARIFKNKTAEMVSVSYANVTVEIDATSQKDLSETFEAWQLGSSESLLLLLGQGTDKYQLNDGTNDLSVSEAIDLVRGYAKAVQPVSMLGVTPTAQGRMPTAAARPIAPKLTFITPNWCDKTTWYCGSEEIEDEVLTDSGDHTTYAAAHQNLIDAYHGKITFEVQLRDDDGSNYRVTVEVNGTKKTEVDPHTDAGDFVVNYAAGTVTFRTPLQPGDAVTMTSHFAQKATFIVKPSAGKRLYIGSVEVQFSEDIVMNDTFVFQAYGLVDVFAPQLMPGIPSGTNIPLGDPLVYKTMVDLLNDSNDGHPCYPPLGGNNWRALKKTAYIFTWEYAVGLTCLEAKYGMEIHIDLEHDVPCSGAFGTATLYCTSEDET